MANRTNSRPGGRPPTKREIREQKVAAAKAAAAKADRRRRQLMAGAVAGVVIIIAVIVGVVVQSGRNSTGTVVPPAGAIDGIALPVGDANAPATLTVYEDFRCPACESFEQTFGSTVNDLIAAGSVKVEYHIASFLDGNLGGGGSKRAANAAGCAADQGKFKAYHDILYANQPPESQDGFTNARLIELAKQVDGLDQAAFATCVNDNVHSGWVKASQNQFDTAFNGQVSTPTIQLNGKTLTGSGAKSTDPALTSVASFKQAVLAAGSAASSGSGASASPTPSS